MMAKANLYSNIDEYYKFLLDHPKRANKKILATYQMLVENKHKENVVEYLDSESGHLENRTYIFDIDKAQRPIRFIEQICKHSKGKWAGLPIKLELWQKAFIEALYGFVDKETGLRKYRKLVLYIGKKNGKSTIDSGLGLYGLTAEDEGGSEVYSIAKIKEQSKLVWTEAKHMVKKSPKLNKALRCTITGIYYDKKDAHFQALASQTNSLDGKNGYYIIADEVWAWEDIGLLDIMQNSVSSREQPLFIETSTAGPIREKVFDKEYEYCDRVIEGYLKHEGGIVDETLLPIIYELDNEEEWLDEECWYKANPNLCVSKKIEYLRERVKKAKNDPSELNDSLFKSL